MAFIVSSHFIKVLGGDDVDLEVNFFFGKIWRKSVKLFSKAGAEMKKIVGMISSEIEV
jgi:hypothetical protein